MFVHAALRQSSVVVAASVAIAVVVAVAVAAIAFAVDREGSFVVEREGEAACQISEGLERVGFEAAKARAGALACARHLPGHLAHHPPFV